MTSTAFDTLLGISSLLHRDMARAFAGTPLTEPRVAVLWVIQTTEGVTTQQHVAEALGVSARNVSGLVDALEAAGYVRRAAHPSDRRAVALELTDVSTELMSTMQREHAELDATLLAAVAPADRDAFQRGLAAISALLEQLVTDAEAADTVRPAS
jgi:DNA-binding MarR family transcriptional regulator